MMLEILNLITGIVSTITGLFFIGLPIFGWEEVKTFLTPAEIPSMQVMLTAIGVIGTILFVSGILTLSNLIG